jgi:hypothetical protein
VPAKAQRHGYSFAFPDLDDALEALFARSGVRGG